jgi:hypothetical protein
VLAGVRGRGRRAIPEHRSLRREGDAVTGKKNIDRSLKRMARKDVTEIRRALRNLRSNQTAMANSSVSRAIDECEWVFENLDELVKEKCRICKKKIEFGYNTCASCEDERGP